MKANHVYVVEWFIQGKWQTTCGARLTRELARWELKRWQACNPRSKFRLRVYVASEKKP